MKKNVWKYGLLTGLAMGGAMALTVPFEHLCGERWGMVIGYTIMVLSLLIVFVGVKHYRDHVLGGAITFGRAFAAGALMMLISCVCYVVIWEALNATVEKHFAHDYSASMVRRAQASGLQGAVLDAQIAKAHAFEINYANPLYRIPLSFMEPLPVGIIMALVTAGILRRKQDGLPNTVSPEAYAS